MVDGENTFRPVYVRRSKIECLTDAQTCDGQKTEEAVIRPRLQAMSSSHVLGCFQLDLFIGIEIGFGKTVSAYFVHLLRSKMERLLNETTSCEYQPDSRWPLYFLLSCSSLGPHWLTPMRTVPPSQRR